MRHLPDHGLPLVALKEQRRDLVVALQNRNGPISGWELMQIAAVQQAISAFEEVIADLDAEAEMEAAADLRLRIADTAPAARFARRRQGPAHLGDSFRDRHSRCGWHRNRQ